MNDEARMTNGRWGWGLAIGVAVLVAMCVSCDREAEVAAPPPKPVPAAPEPPERIWLEAEEAARIEGDGMRIVPDQQASGGRCVEVTQTYDWVRETQSTAAVYYFRVRKPGGYVFWCRRKSPKPPFDAVPLAMRFDGLGSSRGQEGEWRFGCERATESGVWSWSLVYERGRPRQFRLTAGEHVLEILNYECKDRFDAILLTDDRDHVPFGADGRDYVPDPQPLDPRREAPAP